MTLILALTLIESSF